MPRSAVFKFLSRFDEFGHPVGLNYTKNEEYKTWCGTGLSIIKMVLLSIYLLHIVIVCTFRRDPKIQFSEVYRDYEDEEIFPAEIGYDLAYELMTMEFVNQSVTYTNAAKAGYDDTYFNVSALAVSNSIEKGEGSYVFLEAYPCLEFEKETGRRPFKYVSQEKFEKRLKNAMCVDLGEMYFRGTILDGNGLNLFVGSCINRG